MVLLLLLLCQERHEDGFSWDVSFCGGKVLGALLDSSSLAATIAADLSVERRRHDAHGGGLRTCMLCVV